jgi:hypothetical protein
LVGESFDQPIIQYIFFLKEHPHDWVRGGVFVLGEGNAGIF